MIKRTYRLSREQREQAVNLYMEGKMNQVEIAKLFGVSKQNIFQLLKTRNLLNQGGMVDETN